MYEADVYVTVLDGVIVRDVKAGTMLMDVVIDVFRTSSTNEFESNVT